MSLIIIFILSTALAVITSIMVRAIALFFETGSPFEKSEVWSLVFYDFWSVTITWLPALLVIPLILASLHHAVHVRKVSLIFIGSCFMWMIRSIFSTWLAHAVLIKKLDPKYLGLAHISSEIALSGVLIAVASFGWFKKAACDFIIGFALFGCYTGFTIFYSVETFFGVFNIEDVPAAFGRSAMFITFSVAATSWLAVMVARVNSGYSRWNIVGCLLLSTLMAVCVGLAVNYPSIQYEEWIPIPILQYVVVCAVAIAGIIAAVLYSRSIINSNNQLTNDENMRFAMSLMTRNDKSSSSSGTPQMKPISLP